MAIFGLDYLKFKPMNKLYIFGIMCLLQIIPIANAQEYCKDNASIHYEGRKLVAFYTSFVNDSLGYAIASDITRKGNNLSVDTSVILKTTNQGEDWYPVSVISKSFTMPRYKIDFCDANNGFLTVFGGAPSYGGGIPNITYQTEDGGLSWSAFDTKRRFQLLSYQKNVALFTKGDSLYIYTSALTPIKIPGVTSIQAAQVLNDSTLVILGEKSNRMYGYIIQYSNFSWEIKTNFSYPSQGKTKFGLHFQNEENGLFWNNALLCKIQNGDVTSISTPQKIENLEFLGDTLLLVSETALHYSTDQGNSWAEHPYSSIAPTYYFYSITHFLTFKTLSYANPAGLSWIHPYESRPIQILKQPTDVFLKKNCDASFGVLATEGLKYQWYFNNKKLENKRLDSLFIKGCTLANEGSYYCLLSNACASLQTNTVRLNLKNAVEIQRQPQSQEVCFGTDARLSVQADSTYYQWRFKGTPISGANDSVLVISNFQKANIGEYECILTDMDCGGTVTTNIAFLKEKEKMGGIRKLDSLTKVCPNANLVFDIGTVYNATAYTWYKGGDLLESKTSRLQINSISEKDTGLYECKVTGYCGGEAYSKSQVVLHPDLKIIAYSDTLIHCTEAVQIDTLWIKAEHAVSYQWKDRRSNLYEARDSFLILPLSCTTNNEYWCEVKGYCKSRKMPPIVLTRPAKLKNFSLTPNVVCPEDANQIYLYKAEGAEDIISYQWFKNGILLKDSISNYLHIGYDTVNAYVCKASSLYCQSPAYNAPKVRFYTFPDNVKRLPLDTTFYHCIDENIYSFFNSFNVIGQLSVIRTKDQFGNFQIERRTNYGNCFFDRSKIKVLPVVLLTPLEQYIIDANQIQPINGINLDAYSQDTYSYQWKLKGKGDWENIENSVNSPLIMPHKVAGTSAYYPEIISPTSQCSKEIASVNIVDEVVENDSTWFLMHQFSTPINTLCFTNEQTGFIGGDKGYIFKTTTGGRNWSRIDLSGGDKRYTSKISHLRTYDGTQLFLCMGSSNAISYDMGKTWEWILGPHSEDLWWSIWHTNHMYPISPTQSIAAFGKSLAFYEIQADNSSTIRFFGGGNCASWGLFDIAAPPNYLSKKKGAIAVGYRGGIRLQRNDSDFLLVSSDLVANAFSVTFINDDTVFVACSHGQLLYSTQGGERDSWKIIQTPVKDDFSHIQFLNSKVGFVSGANGVFLKTLDGGHTWEVEDVGTKDQITDFYMFSEDIGYMVTQQGKFLKKNATLRKKEDLTVQSPSSMQACVGDTVLFRVKSENATYYQWYKDNSKLKDATDTSIQLIANYSSAGVYTCVVGNSTTELTTTPATLVVLAAPTIQRQPIDQTAFVRDRIKVSVQGNFAETYQWFKDEIKINGANQVELTFLSVQLRDSGSYHCVLSNCCGSVNSNKIKLTVNAHEAEKAYIVESPADKEVCLGEEVSLRVMAINAKSYQWKHNDVNIKDANSASLIFPNITADQLGSYTCEVKGAENTVLSALAEVREYAVPTYTFENDTIYTYQEGDFLMLGFQFDNALSYQWFKNGEAIKEATKVDLSIQALKLSDSGHYRCLAYGHCGTSTQSQNIYIKVTTPEIKDSLTITEQPQNANVCPKETLTFKVVSPQATSFQWYKANTPISKATQNTLVISSVQSDDISTYYCLLSNGRDTIRSNKVGLSIKPLPTINRQPQENIKLFVGDSISLEVQAIYADAYSWTFMDKTMTNPSAQTSTLVLENISKTEAGKYICYVTNECGEISTKNINIEVSAIASAETVYASSSVKLYPNPAREIVSVEASFPIIEIKIMDMSGKQVYNNLILDERKKTSFSVESFSKGLYLVQVTSKDNKIVFIKLSKH